jgi:hypothetical protein
MIRPEFAAERKRYFCLRKRLTFAVGRPLKAGIFQAEHRLPHE